MKTQAQIIKNTINGIYMTGLISRKGWTKQQAAEKVVLFLTSKTSLSFNEFMEAL